MPPGPPNMMVAPQPMRPPGFPAMQPMVRPQAPPPPAAAVPDDEPPSKKQKTEDQLVPEEQWLKLHKVVYLSVTADSKLFAVKFLLKVTLKVNSYQLIF